MSDLSHLYSMVAKMHDHLCPRQVLGVRMGVRAGLELGVDLPQAAKRLVAFVEIDGCTADGVGVATGCWVGRRTMFIVDYGKVAVTFVDCESGRSIRIVPHPSARSNTLAYAPMIQDSWGRQLATYQVMPDDDLLEVHKVRLTLDLAALISEPGKRSTCHSCGEEINNEREVMFNGHPSCRFCAGETYFAPLDASGRTTHPTVIPTGLPSLIAERRL